MRYQLLRNSYKTVQEQLVSLPEHLASAQERLVSLPELLLSAMEHLLSLLYQLSSVT